MENNQPLKVGITGGIGSGKSLVTKIFNLLGISIYDSDSRAKWLMNNSTKVIDAIKQRFGSSAYLDGKLNVTFISKAIFADPNMRSELNAIVHPQVGKDFQNWATERKNEPYIIKEAALMFEANAHLSLDKVIVVSAPIELRIKRVLERDPQRTRDAILAIMDSQMAEKDKLEKADYIIYNDDSQLVIPQVIRLHNIFSQR
ncbi:MAG TPA: dephospho-CoA kinase [Cytophagaceae bacterium]|jgi:dephospho-CoA kinase